MSDVPLLKKSNTLDKKIKDFKKVVLDNFTGESISYHELMAMFYDVLLEDRRGVVSAIKRIEELKKNIELKIEFNINESNLHQQRYGFLKAYNRVLQILKGDVK